MHFGCMTLGTRLITIACRGKEKKTRSCTIWSRFAPLELRTSVYILQNVSSRYEILPVE